MPPLKSSAPIGSKRNVWPEVFPPKRAASVPSASVKTVTPGITAALRRSSVSSQSAPAPAGLRNSTEAFSLPRVSAMIWANSPMLARVQGQCGCASMTSVGFGPGRGRTDFAGQVPLTTPIRPGVLSYRIRTPRPSATAAIHTAPSTPVKMNFLRRKITSVSEPATVLKHAAFHSENADYDPRARRRKLVRCDTEGLFHSKTISLLRRPE